MRNRILVAAVLTVAVGAGAAESVATSPECERWIADYRQKLAQTHPVQVAHKQGDHLKRYVHRQIAVMRHKPTMVRTASPRDPLRPGLTPQQMVKRFQVLCGDLPPVHTAQLVPPVPQPVAPITPLAQPGITGMPDVPITPAMSSSAPSTPGTPINTPPVNVSEVPPPPTTQPPSGGGGTPPAPPVPPVPEPSSFALVLVGGFVGAALLARKVA